jgi:hypothetical protein
MSRAFRSWTGGVLALLLMALLAACGPSTFTLRLHLKQGDVYKVTTVTKQHISQEIMGQKMSLDQKMTMEYRWEVTQVADNGNTTIKVTYTRVAMEQDQGGQKRAFDSASGQEPPDFFKGLDLLVGKSFSVEFTPQGEVVKIDGLDEMFRQVAEGVGFGDKESTDAFYKALTDSFGEDAITEQFKTAFGDYPHTPLKVGTTWTADAQLKVTFPLEVHATYTVKSWQDDQAVIAMEATLKSDATKRVTGQNPLFDVVYDLSGTQQGTLTVDVGTGLLRESQVTQHVEGQVLLVDPKSKDNTDALPMPFSMDTNITTTVAPQGQ